MKRSAADGRKITSGSDGGDRPAAERDNGGRVRTFNTAGPVRAHRHYQIAPLSRIDLDEVLGLIRYEKYFVLHAPRQTGKTSALLSATSDRLLVGPPSLL